MAPPPGALVASRLRVIRAIFAALLGSLVVYAALVHVLGDAVRRPATVAPAGAATLRWVLHAIGGLTFVGALAARGRALGPDALIAAGRQVGPGAALDRLQTRTVALLALMESVAIYGLVLFFLTGRLADFYPLWALGLVGLLLLAPRAEPWEAIGRAVSPAVPRGGSGAAPPAPRHG
jgi:hypothetical protein